MKVILISLSNLHRGYIVSNEANYLFLADKNNDKSFTLSTDVLAVGLILGPTLLVEKVRVK